MLNYNMLNWYDTNICVSCSSEFIIWASSLSLPQLETWLLLDGPSSYFCFVWSAFKGGQVLTLLGGQALSCVRLVQWECVFPWETSVLFSTRSSMTLVTDPWIIFFQNKTIFEVLKVLTVVWPVQRVASQTLRLATVSAMAEYTEVRNDIISCKMIIDNYKQI